MTFSTPCIRCGKMRIEAKSWIEKEGSSVLSFTQTVCPDPECQKIVEEQLQKKKDKIETLHRESLKRRLKNSKNRKKNPMKIKKPS